MATITVSVTTNKPFGDYSKVGQKHQNVIRLINLFTGLSSGALIGSVSVSGSTVDPVRASGTITLVSCATDTVTIGKTTFTGTGTPSTSLHFETDGTDTADAAALAAAINAHTDTSKIVTATSALGVVTVTANQAGLLGNHIALAETGTTMTISASFLAGGTGGSSATPVVVR